MTMKSKTHASLQELLSSCSDSLFPADLGAAPVALDSRDIDGDTPLHIMMWRDNTQAILQLVEAGADVNAVGDMSETPLHIAVKKRNIAAIEAMLKAGADAYCLSEFGQSPQSLAEEIGGEIRRIFDSP